MKSIGVICLLFALFGAALAWNLEEPICLLPPAVVGPCNARIERWTYNNRRCVRFYYGGCDGNDNNFITEENCKSICESQG
ncbi:kunitz-type serine protease inhibitor HCRG2-like [Scaptodrosophila lebanonensis]|uniref:Kunitz-type serine protease inhibitor HCRG2-like n=1 Tax=Drosophila lebanonensis TaxID=7225 RepID=A0A6J2U7X7_DROLE|nr:kunitz-type serine protease inhibitor HCRG2-like [Scaptodrosophila lebanonensis]